jgi:hypothetical protein
MTTKKYFERSCLEFGLLVLVILLSTACGAKLIRGAAPIVHMKELSHLDHKITLQLSMRNLNGVALDIENIDFSLAMNEDELFTYSGPVDSNIVANGTETWSVEIAESSTGRELLDSLQNGEVKSLPYALKGSVTTKDDGTLRFEYEGHLYPLPGRPGHFR